MLSTSVAFFGSCGIQPGEMNGTCLALLGTLAVAGCAGAPAPPARLAAQAEPPTTTVTPAEPPAEPAKSKLDEEYTASQLSRATAFARAQCGAATNDAGERKGPWGKATVTLKIGRNGRPLDVTIAAPHAGTPTGNCVIHAFEALVFLPYPGDHDEAREVEVTIDEPTAATPAAE
jgi:hypothetical protein